MLTILTAFAANRKIGFAFDKKWLAFTLPAKMFIAGRSAGLHLASLLSKA
jgi:hypothetical protein